MIRCPVCGEEMQEWDNDGVYIRCENPKCPVESIEYESDYQTYADRLEAENAALHKRIAELEQGLDDLQDWKDSDDERQSFRNPDDDTT